MLDIKLIREKSEFVKKALRRRNVDPVQIDNILSLDTERRELLVEIENLQAKRNKSSKEIPSLKGTEKEKLLSELQYIKEQLHEKEPKLKKREDELQNLLIALPNLPDESAPTSESVVKIEGKLPKFSFEPKDHVTLGKALDWIDIESATAGSGARFYYLKNQAVLLEFALVQFVLSKLAKKGFTPIIPPVLVKEYAMFGTGFFPAERNEIYHVNPGDDDVYLAGTGEVPLCMLYANKTLETAELPKRFIGFSTCFRREAGTYGKDTHGIFRVHQFDKLEMFSFCNPETSSGEHEFLLSVQEEIMKELGLHYRVVNICTGDLGAPAAKKYDIEVWIPSQKRFRELTSCSNCTDFQARRCNIKVRGAQFAHTLNGTAIAMSRMIIAIMENFQQKDGTIEIPKCLKI